MKTDLLRILGGITFLSLSVCSNADLQSRLGGQAVYDTDLNITWLADAGGAGSPRGLMTWAAAEVFAAGFSLGGATEWRLPATLHPDASCGDPGSSSGFNCEGSEMGHLFYIQLGGTAGDPITDSINPDLNLFTNISGANWWSGTTFLIPELAWDFRLADGRQGASNKVTFTFFVWPVHDGDVFAPPPDSDGDGVDDTIDNCTIDANPGQEDTDADLIGNRCDGDYTNDCVVNFLDISLFPPQFLGFNPLFNHDASGSVTFLDYAILTSYFTQPPGPSAAGCN